MVLYRDLLDPDPLITGLGIPGIPGIPTALVRVAPSNQDHFQKPLAMNI